MRAFSQVVFVFMGLWPLACLDQKGSINSVFDDAGCDNCDSYNSVETERFDQVDMIADTNDPGLGDLERFEDKNIASDQEPPISDHQTRIQNRTFPSIFQAWSPADNLPNEDQLVTLARHDLVWHAPEYYTLQWDQSPKGLATGFTPSSISSGLARRDELLQLNPNLVLIAEIRYRDAPDGFLPSDHIWWLRDQNGNRIPGWAEGGYYKLDFTNPDFREHVALRAQAAVESGVLDGVMLDWWKDDADRLALVQVTRTAVGDKLIITNPNHNQTPETAPFINGYFMECYQSATPEDWATIVNTLIWAEKNLRTPRVNCVETWYHNSRDDLKLMRSVTTLVLTLSDGYALFSDPNSLPTPDHLHNWYEFWNKSLGKPLQPGVQNHGAWIRNFEKGKAIYNPLGNDQFQEVNFQSSYRSVSTGKVGTTHVVPAGDGDIFIKAP